MLYLQLIAGLVFLVIGGDVLVRGAVATAKRFGVSPLMIGLTLVGVGTSTPELVTSLNAALAGSPDLAIGNVVGSNIANILLILGAAAVIFPIACAPKVLLRDGSMALAAAVAATLVFCFAGVVSAVAGAVFVCVFVAYIAGTYLKERAHPDEPSAHIHEEEVHLAEPGPKSLWAGLALAIGGIALTILGANWLVDSSIVLARRVGVSETMIGLTVVAVGTSLPELVTGVMAALRRQSDIVLGNVLGSNISNILFIVGLTAMVKPIHVDAEILRLDAWVMIGTSLLLGVFAWTGRRISRREGVVFLVLYLAYMVKLAANAGMLR